jgi:hypothetical protein
LLGEGIDKSAAKANKAANRRDGGSAVTSIDGNWLSVQRPPIF